MSDCYFSDIQAISNFFFMLRLDAIRITRVLWFIQFVLDKIHQVKNDFPLCGQLRSKKGLKISLSFGQIVLAFGQFMSVPPLFENPRTPMMTG